MRIGVAGEHQFVVRQAAQLSERQFGAIARRQLLEVGASREQIRGWLSSGRLHPRYPGVYAYGRSDLRTEGELASGLLYSGSGSALTGLSGLWWLELLHRRPNLIHLDAPGRKASRQDLRIHHPSEIERQVVRGLPVASLNRVLFAASDALSHNSLRLVLARAEFHRLLDLRNLQAALTTAPRGSTCGAGCDGRPPSPACSLRQRLRARVRAPLRALPPRDPRARTSGSAATARTCSGARTA